MFLLTPPEKNPDKVSQTSRIGWTGLHIAAACGHKKSASLLLRKGADLAAVDKKGRTPLHLACRYGQLDMYKYLVGKAAEMSFDRRGLHPLHLACKYGWTQLVATLLNDLASAGPSNGQTDNGRSTVTVAELLGTADEHGRTPLLIGLRSNKPDLVRLLVQHGASLDDVDERGCDVVHLGTSLANPFSWLSFSKKPVFHCSGVSTPLGVPLRLISQLWRVEPLMF